MKAKFYNTLIKLSNEQVEALKKVPAGVPNFDGAVLWIGEQAAVIPEEIDDIGDITLLPEYIQTESALESFFATLKNAYKQGVDSGRKQQQADMLNSLNAVSKSTFDTFKDKMEDKFETLSERLNSR